MTNIDWLLLKSLVSNFRSEKMNRDFIGFEFEAMTNPVIQQESIAFATAINDMNPVYEQENIASPFFISKLVYPMIKKVMCHKKLRMNILRMVHAQQKMTWHSPIKVNDHLKLHVKIKDIHDTPVGEMIEILAHGYRDKQLIFESNSGLIVRSKLKRPAKKSEEESAMKQSFRIEIPTEEGQQFRYARASGDNNSIHTNNFLAKMAGLPRTIMHGACVLAMSCSTMVREILDNDIARLSSVRGRFGKPAIPGQKLILIGYESIVPNEIPFEVVNESGQSIFKNGFLQYKDTK